MYAKRINTRTTYSTIDVYLLDDCGEEISLEDLSKK